MNNWDNAMDPGRSLGPSLDEETKKYLDEKFTFIDKKLASLSAIITNGFDSIERKIYNLGLRISAIDRQLTCLEERMEDMPWEL